MILEPLTEDDLELTEEDLKGAWLEENRAAIEAYNEIVAQRGVFSTGLRGF